MASLQFSFGPYRLDVGERQLLRGTETIPLSPKLFDLLAVLVGNPGRLLQKQELLDRVWRDTAVEEGSLTRGISSLRQALGSSAEGHEYIQTVAKHGYRFTANVQEATGESSDSAVARRVPLPPALRDAPAIDFVGREAELRHVDEVWDVVRKGRHQLVLVAGEAGIGKTRLAREFARRRAAEGATVLAGSCDEDVLVGYQPFVEALSWYFRVCSEPDLRVQLAATGGGGELASLIPELRHRVPDIPTSPPMTPDAQRYRLFEAVAAFLAAVSRRDPLLLVFDDLHWADKATLLLLRHVTRSSTPGAVAIVATYRESELTRTHPLADMLLKLRSEPGVTRLPLRGLASAHVRDLANAIVGSDAPARLAQLVTERTEGNALFAIELLKHLHETGSTARFCEPGTAPVHANDLLLSEGIKEVVGRRLSRLSARCNDTLHLAAVIGREFELPVLEAVADLPGNDVLDALDEAVRAQVVSEVRDATGRFAFTHALVRETLYDELTSARRMRLHRRVADAIEHQAQDANLPLAELAYHFTHAASAESVDKAVEYARRAGDRAAEALAHEEAARLFDMALHSLELKRDDAGTADRRVDLHARRARAFDALGAWTLEVRELQAALRYLDPAQRERRCELLLALARALFLLFDVGLVARHATDAMQIAEDIHRPDLAASAIAWVARCRQAMGDLAGAVDLDRRAAARAPGVTTATQMLGPLTLYLAGRSTEAVTLALEAVKAGRGSRDTSLIMYSMAHLGLSLAAAGRYDEATSAFHEVRTFGRKYGALSLLARATAMAAGLHLNVFDYEGAEALQAEACELARASEFPPPLISASIDALLTRARRHDPGGAERLLEDTTAAAATTGGWHQWLWRLRLAQAKAELALARDAFETARVTATEAIDESRRRGRLKYEALGLITRARALHGLGRSRAAIADAHAAVAVAARTEDPALLLLALDVLLPLDGNDESLARAIGVADRIHAALPDAIMQRCFVESEVVQRLGVHRS